LFFLFGECGLLVLGKPKGGCDEASSYLPLSVVDYET